LVDKILLGRSPSIFRSSGRLKFDLVVNLIVAKAIGLDVPPSLLADEVIE
jgi:putative ABC transport system substrate-binding protein